MIEWFARNSVAANLLMWLIIMGGAIVFFTQLQVETFPSPESDSISIQVALRGSTPEDIELGVAVRIEEAVQDLEGIKEMVSLSREGSTTIRLEVDSGYDAREMLADVKSRVDAINTFPVDAEKPIINLRQFNYAVISVVVSGELSKDEIQIYAEKVREDILRLKGITQAELRYERAYEINIEVPQDTLRNLGLSLADVASAVQANSQDISAGNLRTRGGDILIRSQGQAYRRVDFEAIVIKSNADGSLTRLGDVATVRDSFTEDGLNSTFNGDNSVTVAVSRVGKQSAIQVSRTVRQYIEDQQGLLPAGVALSYWDDDAAYLKKRISALTKSMVQGSILVMLLLAIFLRPAVAFWVLVGIPISFIGSTMLLGYFGHTINIMSLFGFILVLGLVVDDAIVTGESIYSSLQSGRSGVDAAIHGTNRVAIPVTFGVLTTIAAFVPLAMMEGMLGGMTAPIPAVVISVLLISLIETKLILPAHLKRLKPPTDRQKKNKLFAWQMKVANGFERFILKYYQPLLVKALRNRYSILVGFVGVFAITVALLSSGWVRFTFMPRVPAETMVVSLTMPVGTPFEVTDRHIARIASVAKELEAYYSDDQGNSSVRHVMAVTGAQRGAGGNASNIGTVAMELLSPENRPVSVESQEVTREWRKRIGTVPGADEIRYRAEIFSVGDPINVQFAGASFERLDEVTAQVKQRLTQYPTVFDIADSLAQGKEELHIELTQQGQVLGLTRSVVLGQISQAFRGFEAQRVQRGRDDVRVLIRLPKNERSNAATLDELLIDTPDGQRIPLAHVAHISPAVGPAQIKRIDRYRVINVTADFNKEKTNALALMDDLRGYIDQLLVNYPDVSYSFEGEAKEQRESSQVLVLSMFALLFFIYCLLALPLKSYGKPFIVMSVIPFSLVGAVVGHMLLGHPMTMLSYMGLMALIGVVINDSLVLVDFVGQSTNEGSTLDEAVEEAGVKRFRAVILTSLTTFFGLMPMMVVTNTQSLFLVPMAISLGCGILFATAITLLLVPVNLLIARDIKYLVLGWFNSGDSNSTSPVVKSAPQ